MHASRLPTALAVIAAVCSCRRDRLDLHQRAPSLTPPAPTVPAPRTAPAGVQVTLPSGHTIADVAARVTPSVVNVFSERRLREQEPIDELLGVPHRQHHSLSLGSGVVIDRNGIIVTNSHVIAHADRILVALKDGREMRARLVGTDPRSDVAVLQVAARDLPAIEMADASKIRVGDLVLAIGNPFGIGQTVTMGIISATGRANLGITDVEDFIQTDAAINPGNSGGALVDMDGKLVGLNTAIVSGSGGYQGIGFAIPSNIVLQVAAQLVKNGKVTRGWLGVSIADVTGEIADALHIAPRTGVLIADIAIGSPAARAGLRRGDVITSINHVPITDAAHLRNLVALAGPGRIVVQLQRGGRSLVIQVDLVEAPRDIGPDPEVVSSVDLPE